VDACWGGPALLVDEYRRLFRGIETADSVSIDAHKLLYCPMSMGIILFRNEKDLHVIKHSSRYIIRKNSVDTGRFTIEGSRSFACLKPWAALKIIGREGYGLLLREARKSTETLVRIVDGCGNFETLNIPELFIVTYRFIPEEVRNSIIHLSEKIRLSKGRESAKELANKIRKINLLINGLNMRRDDSTFVSRTTLESTRYRPQNIVVLRAVLVNPLIDEEVLSEIVHTQNRIGLELWREFEPVYRRI
jgi:glutamate decarboxylase